MKRHIEILLQFLWLGCLSFGGPAAHIAYFYKNFVEKKKWIDDKEFANRLALSQFLPGPSSSQLGFSIGMHRAGVSGGIMAFIGFTTPSFLLMYCLAVYSLSLPAVLLNIVISALKLFAVAIIFDAVLTMAKSFCRTIATAFIAIATTLFLLLYQSIASQMIVLIVIALMAIIYTKFFDNNTISTKQLKKLSANSVIFSPKFILSFTLFLSILLFLPLIAGEKNMLAWFSKFFNAGSLVFGGGHVVLPLLQQMFLTEISNDNFIMGYAAAQALPGPIFTFATYLGAILAGNEHFVEIPLHLLSAMIATFAIFLPGFWLLCLVNNHWQMIAAKPEIKMIITAINAAVVGMLLAAWLNPVVISAIKELSDVIFVVFGFALIRFTKLPILLTIAVFIALVSLRYFLNSLV